MSAEFIWKLWNQQYGLAQENFYSELLRSSRNLLGFETPQGLQMNFTSCPSDTFSNSHRLTVFPDIGGSISFLHSSRPILGYRGTNRIPLNAILEGYQPVKEVEMPEAAHMYEIWQRGRRIDQRDTLLYGRLHLPYSKLEAIYARRLSPTRQVIISALSSASLSNGGSIFAQIQSDYGSHTSEWIYNTDDALIGFRHMRQLGGDGEARVQTNQPARSAEIADADAAETANLMAHLPFSEYPSDLPLSAYGRFSAGMEVYYGALYKSGGVSVGMRFSTLPSYHGHPRTMTLTVNPLVGHLSSTYTMKAHGLATVCSRLDFNIFSYESDLTLGGEIWHYPAVRAKQALEPTKNVDDIETETRIGFEVPESSKFQTLTNTEAQPSGVIKAFVHSNDLTGSLLWSGRIRDFLISLGGKFDLKQRSLGTIGIEIQYGSDSRNGGPR